MKRILRSPDCEGGRFRLFCSCRQSIPGHGEIEWRGGLFGCHAIVKSIELPNRTQQVAPSGEVPHG